MDSLRSPLTPDVRRGRAPSILVRPRLDHDSRIPARDHLEAPFLVPQPPAIAALVSSSPGLLHPAHQTVRAAPRFPVPPTGPLGGSLPVSPLRSATSRPSRPLLVPPAAGTPPRASAMLSSSISRLAGTPRSPSAPAKAHLGVLAFFSGPRVPLAALQLHHPRLTPACSGLAQLRCARH